CRSGKACGSAACGCGRRVYLRRVLLQGIALGDSDAPAEECVCDVDSGDAGDWVYGGGAVWAAGRSGASLSGCAADEYGFERAVCGLCGGADVRFGSDGGYFFG